MLYVYDINGVKTEIRGPFDNISKRFRPYDIYIYAYTYAHTARVRERVNKFRFAFAGESFCTINIVSSATRRGAVNFSFYSGVTNTI